MATTKVTLTSSWQLVAAADKSFIADNASSYNVEVTFADSAPAAGAPYHTLKAGEGIVRLGVVGGLYARDATGDAGIAYLIVSTS